MKPTMKMMVDGFVSVVVVVGGVMMLGLWGNLVPDF